MTWSTPARALAGGALCLAILAGMIVSHAWPLWTGRPVVLTAAVAGKGDRHSTGEYLRLTTPAMRIALDELQPGDSSAARIQPIGAGWEVVGTGPGWGRPIRGREIFVQLENRAGVHQPVTASFSPVAGATNLRGRVHTWRGGSKQEQQGARVLEVNFGLEAYYLQQGLAERLATDIGKMGTVQMEVAIAASGRARIKRLLLNGQPVS